MAGDVRIRTRELQVETSVETTLLNMALSRINQCRRVGETRGLHTENLSGPLSFLLSFTSFINEITSQHQLLTKKNERRMMKDRIQNIKLGYYTEAGRLRIQEDQWLRH